MRPLDFRMECETPPSLPLPPRWMGDHYNILAQYYSVPSVAVRNGEGGEERRGRWNGRRGDEWPIHSPVLSADPPVLSSDPSSLMLLPTNPSHVSPPGLYHAYRQGKGIFSDISETYPPNNHQSMTHPNLHGHEFLADLIIYAFYRTLDQVDEYGEYVFPTPMSCLRLLHPPIDLLSLPIRTSPPVASGITQGDLDLLALPQPAPLYAKQQEIILGAWHDIAIQVRVHAGRWVGGWSEASGDPGNGRNTLLATFMHACMHLCRT
jgi:hypothetical protein